MRGRREPPKDGDNATPGLLRKDSRSKSYSSGEKSFGTIHLGDIKRMKSTHMDRNSYRVAKRSTLIENPSPNASYSAILSDRLDQSTENFGDASVRIPEPSENEKDRESKVRMNELGTLGNAEALTLSDMSHIGITNRQPHHYRKPSGRLPKHYFAELSALEYFIVKHIAVLSMEQMMKEYFTLEELLDLIESRKATLWGKFVTSLKAGNQKKPKTKCKLL